MNSDVKYFCVHVIYHLISPMGRTSTAFIRFSSGAVVKMCIIWSIHIFITVDSSECSLKCIILKQIVQSHKNKVIEIPFLIKDLIISKACILPSDNVKFKMHQI